MPKLEKVYYPVLGGWMLANAGLCFVRMTLWLAEGVPSWHWIPGMMIGVLGCHLTLKMHEETNP